MATPETSKDMPLSNYILYYLLGRQFLVKKNRYILEGYIKPADAISERLVLNVGSAACWLMLAQNTIEKIVLFYSIYSG